MTKEELKKIILKAIDQPEIKNDLKSIRLFGSYLHGTPKESSDVDLLIEFSPSAKVGFFRLVNIQNTIGQFVGKKIDLLTPEALSKYFKDDILKTAEPIYER